MENITFLITPGGGPGILPELESLYHSRKYKARIILADSNPSAGNMFLPEVNKRYRIPECNTDAFIPAILRLIEKEKVDFYYSGLDEEMPVLARNRDKIEALGCQMLLPSFHALECSLDKESMYDVLRTVVRLPETFPIDDDINAENIYETLEGRPLIKATSLRGGRHIYIPEDKEEFLFYLRRAHRLSKAWGLSFIVQKCIEGIEFNVTTLHDLDKNLIYAISRRKFEARQIKSTTIAARIEKRKDVIDQAVSAVEAMGLVPGFNNVESIVSDHDNEPYLIEINGGRTAAQDMNIVKSGINLTDLLVDIVRGKKVGPVPHPPDGMTILKIKKDVVVHYDEVEKVPYP